MVMKIIRGDNTSPYIIHKVGEAEPSDGNLLPLEMDDDLRASTLVCHVWVLRFDLRNGSAAFFLSIGGRCDCRVDRFAETRDLELINGWLGFHSRFVAIRRASVDAFQEGNC